MRNKNVKKIKNKDDILSKRQSKLKVHYVQLNNTNYNTYKESRYHKIK